MNWILNWDVSYIVQQTAILSLYPVVPLLVIAVIGRRRNLFVWCGCAYIATFAVALVIIVSSALGFFGKTPPYKPFRVGPSLYSIRSLLYVFIIWLWIPALTILGALMIVIKARRKHSAIPAAMRGIAACFAIIGSIWTVFLFHACGFMHEDTRWSANFSIRRWQQIEEGMTRQELLALMGRPLNVEKASGSETLMWSVFLHTGYCAKVVVEDGKVVSVDRPLRFNRHRN
ncbi:MAG: hypothetical protein ACOX9C_01260 [Kiritimatiellia bacterium]|jgi:hypothetical protein